MNAPALPENWMRHLGAEFQKDYMLKLRDFLASEIKAGKVVYPHGSEIFAAFQHTPFDKVRIVILGQDPYHGPGQAHGLSFSVKKGVPPPPSLVNIYQELHQSLGFIRPGHGFLEPWAHAGVLLLNSVLTVEQNQAASHQGRGWEIFTDQVIQTLNQKRDHLVFMLWGAYAQRKGAVIDRTRHLVLQAPHPSPLSAYRGFLGCGHFKKANEYLTGLGLEPIDWTLAS